MDKKCGGRFLFTEEEKKIKPDQIGEGLICSKEFLIAGDFFSIFFLFLSKSYHARVGGLLNSNVLVSGKKLNMPLKYKGI